MEYEVMECCQKSAYQCHTPVCGDKLPFRAFVNGHYLPFACQNKLNWKREEFNLTKHILPYLGEYPLGGISSSVLKGWTDALQHSGFAYSTCYRFFWLVKYILNCAVRWGFLVDDHAFKDALFREGKPRTPVLLDHNKILTLIRLLEEHPNRNVANAIHLLLLTGASKSEILSACWDDLDLSQRTLATSHAPNGRQRLIPLNDEAVRLISTLPRQEGVPWLFSTRTGKRLSFLWRVWDEIRTALGCPDILLQDLRHTFASMLLGIGVRKDGLSSIMGHYRGDTLALVMGAQSAKKSEQAAV